MCGPLLTVPNRHELYIDLQYTFSSSYFCGGPGNLEICSDSEHHPRYDEDGAHPRHGGNRGGDYLNDALAARAAGALLLLPGEGFAALADSAAFDIGDESVNIVKSFCGCIHGSLLVFVEYRFILIWIIVNTKSPKKDKKLRLLAGEQKKGRREAGPGKLFKEGIVLNIYLLWLFFSRKVIYCLYFLCITFLAYCSMYS